MQEKIIKFAKSLGFDLVGFSPAKIEEKYLHAFEDWIAEGLHADMAYMEKFEERKDLSKILPGAKSVIILGMNYYYEQPPLKAGHGRVARYAYGRDYHKVIGKKLRKIEGFIGELANDKKTVQDEKFSPANRVVKNTLATVSQKSGAGPTQVVDGLASPVTKWPAPHHLTKSYVDTGPILERALAEQSGIGIIGKNGCVISPEFGSWIFLSEIITTLDLTTLDLETSKQCSDFAHTASRLYPLKTTQQKPEKGKNFPGEKIANFEKQCSGLSSSTQTLWQKMSATGKDFPICGNCTKCIDSCPTGAIIAPGVIDSRLCISYLTIENKDKISPTLAKIIKKTKKLYGCDICQEVCPHNAVRQKSTRLHAKIAGSQLSLKKISNIKDQDHFIQTFAGSPLTRAKHKGLSRNAKILT